MGAHTADSTTVADGLASAHSASAHQQGEVMEETEAKHKIRWFVVWDGKRMPRQASMRGTWGYDAACSCGWDSRVGGGVERYIKQLIWEHKWDVENGFWEPDPIQIQRDGSVTC